MTRIAAVVVRPVMQSVAAVCGQTATVWAYRPRRKVLSPWRAEETQNPAAAGEYPLQQAKGWESRCTQ